MAARRAATTWVGGVNRHWPVFCMYCHWSSRSMASEPLLPAERSSSVRRAMTKPMPGTPSRHLPDAAMSAAKRVVGASIGMAPKELIASMIKPRPRFATTVAISGRGFRIPVPVSQCTCATCVIEGSASSAASIRAGSAGSCSPCARTAASRPRYLRLRTMRLQSLPLSGTSTLLPLGTSVPSAASTANVPLPCSGTQTCSPCALTMATRSRHTDAVSSLNAPSHEPQSLSIADLVSAEVVSGPGVSSIGSGISNIGSVMIPRSAHNRFGRQALCGYSAPAKRGILEPAALERTRALEHGISGRTNVRMDALEIAQNVQIQRIGLDGFRRPLAQARQIIFGKREFSFTQLCLCRYHLTCNVHIAGHENTNREPQAVDDLLVKLGEIGLALLREGDAAPYLLGCKVH